MSALMGWVMSEPAKFSQLMPSKYKHQRQVGISLIELVISMVLFAFAATLLTSLFYSQSVRSVEPMFQIRAAELGQALMDEVLSKAYAHNTPVGGVPPCDTVQACTPIGNDGQSRPQFDDVDDYNDYCNTASPFLIRDVLDEMPEDFDGFSMSICVGYDGNYNGAVNEAGTQELQAKLIQINIYPPTGAGIGGSIRFAAYRGNF